MFPRFIEGQPQFIEIKDPIINNSMTIKTIKENYFFKCINFCLIHEAEHNLEMFFFFLQFVRCNFQFILRFIRKQKEFNCSPSINLLLILLRFM